MDYLQIKNKSKILTHWEEKCVEQLKSILSSSDTYTLLTIPDFNSILDLLYYADNLRIKWLISNHNGCYVDLDCFLESRFEPPNDGKCYLPITEDRIDIFYIFTNNNPRFLKENFKFHRRGDYYGWPESELKRIRNENKFGTIPDFCYKHTFTSLKPFMESQRRVKWKTQLI